MFGCSLYPIIDIDLCGMRGIDPRTLALAFFDGGARTVQVRQKSAASGALVQLTREIVATASTRAARVILNDRADLARMAGAAGVHVGQNDLSPAEVKAIAGQHAIVGLSTHTRAQVDAAVDQPVEYIAVGPVFQTRTKDTGYEPRGLELVRYAATRGRPVVAIGGIRLDNVAEVLAAGASAVAVISDLLASADAEARVREYLRVCA
ncbi:MAG: thiamine phosphate synthase [Vicinamibacterales bacterium]